ncbi:hypothetical protein [Endozoicomonas sp. ONNA2]|uniref:hypothetical protein n=1 Tax=Endozoicomonas sp. ONNA2 TaxID=2828741 RepID=UPI0021481126|nr:hypothetical protein [Endozoicomonas sp. ONNA2]
MQTPTEKNYAASIYPGNVFSASPGQENAGTGKTGQLNGLSVIVRSAVIPFFQSLSPDYQQPLANNNESDSRPVALPGQSMLNNVCQSAGFVAQLTGAWVPPVKVLADVASKLCVAVSFGDKVIDYMQEKDATKREPSEQKCAGEQHGSAAQISIPRGVLAAAAMVTMGQIPVSAAAESGKATGRPIPVPDRETLEQIGQNDRYLLSDDYIQTQDINSDVSIGSEDRPFYGNYDGGCHKITGQRRCLFGKVADHGVVSNLRLAQARVESNDEYSAVVACKIGEGSLLKNLKIEHSSVLNDKDGIGAAFPSWMTNTGVITGHQQENSYIEQVVINNCSVTGTGNYGSSGIVSGWSEGDIQQVTIDNSRIKTAGWYAYAGIGAGTVGGRINYLTVLNSQVETDGVHSFAGIGGGVIDEGKVANLTVVNSSVHTEKDSSVAGIGAGKCIFQGTLAGTTAISCNVTTVGEGADAGIGVGYSRGDVLDTKAIDCFVNTTGQHAHAAIGTGFFQAGKTVGVTAVRGGITASGRDAKGDIGAGSIDRYLDRVNHPSVINMKNSVKAVNVTVNGRLHNIGNVSRSSLDQLCDIADQRFVANDCRVMNQSSTGDWNCTATDLPWVPSSASTSATGSIPTSRQISNAPSTMNTGLVNYSQAPTTLTSLVTGAQAASTLSTGAIVGISVGVAAALGIGALFTWRYYTRRQADPDALTMSVLKNIQNEELDFD